MITQENIPYTADEIKAMVKTNEELRKKYNDALERARDLMTNQNPPAFDKHLIEMVFPELAEIEDERIRKAIMSCCIDHGSKYKYLGVSMEEMCAWLEKQGKIDKASYEIAEKEKYDFVSGQFIECRKSFNEFKEDNSYWFEYVGNDTYIGRSDNILNKKFHITPMQLYRLFTQQHCPKENDVNEETNAPTGYGKYVDECLYEAAEHFFSEGEDKYSVADLFYAGVRCGKSCLEKQGEQQTDPCTDCTDDKGCVTCENGNFPSLLVTMKETKSEPKFHPGDWIIDNVGNIFQIERVFETIIKDKFGYITVGGVYFNDNNDVRLWTIQDAKDGDALCTYECDEPKIVFILKGAPKKHYALSYHCYYNIMYPYFDSDSENGCLAPNDADVKPATKEQRDLLYSKMREAGYEWNTEKNELKKIEQNLVDKVWEKFTAGDWV